MRERDEDLTWRVRGVCQSVDPEVFFPAPSEPADAAVALCRTCDVQGACLAWALQVGDCHGVWGATTPRERRAMLVAWHSDEVQEELAARSVPTAGIRPEDRLGPEAEPLTLEHPHEPVDGAGLPPRTRTVLLPTPRLPTRELAPTA
jgi:hypothetical protein